mgnify:CR=1 FL=1
MNIITQFFRNSKEEITLYLKNIEVISKDTKVKTIFIFSDIRLPRIDKVQVFRRDTRLKWVNVFDFILSNKHINTDSTYILEPDKNITKYYNTDGVIINNSYVYIKNIKKSYPIRRYIFRDYDYLRLKINGYRIKVASICHIYYEDMIEEMISKCSNLSKLDIDVDYYFTLSADSSTIGQKEWVKASIKQSFPDAKILIVPNKGLDIGAFFKVLIEIINKDYDYIVKTHTKKSLKTSGEYFGKVWRNDLLSILDSDKLPMVYDFVLKGSEMITSNKWIIDIEKDSFNVNKVHGIITELKIEPSTHFVGGTMFWMRFEVLKQYFNKEVLEKYYNQLEEGYFYQIDKSNGEYLTHAFERVFGLMCKIDGV